MKYNLRKSIKITGAAMLTLSLSACISEPERPLTPEEKEFQQKAMQAMLNRMNGGAMQYGANQVSAQKEQDKTPDSMRSDEDLKAAIIALPAVSGGVSFERSKEGILIDGQHYVDPEGPIINFGFNAQTGDYTYLLKNGDASYAIKYNKAGSGVEPLILANMRNQGGMLSLTTVTGKKLSGDNLVPTSRGFVVVRGASAFGYDPMSGVKSFSASNGYHVARFQNGDIASTGYILLEKDEESKKDNPIAAVTGVFDAVANAGNAFGVIDHASDDYMLANIETGQTVVLDVSLSGKQVGDYSGCETKATYVKGAFRLNECDHVDFRESLYRQDGSPNFGHYFWKVYWFNTSDDAFVIAQEASQRKITITELSSGKKVTAFERALGIQSFTVDQRVDGTIAIAAKLGFSSESIPDAIDFFNKHQMLTVNE